jgi:hypothetical protein
MTPNASINVSVSNHYREPAYDSEIVSQGLLGERIEIIQREPLFTRIQQSDGYTSWVSSDQIAEGDIPHGTSLLVTSHFMKFHQGPSSESPCIRDGVIGCRLQGVDEKDGWYRVTLPDGIEGWGRKKHFGPLPDFSPGSIVALAREFLGCQYLWGGRSPKGFDCSGLVQTVFGLHGVTLPRDSWQQQKHNIISKDFRLAEPGDLLFFAKTPQRVTHVALAVENQRFIHASGWVKYNSLRQADDDFSGDLLKTFVSVNRYPAQETSP